MRLIDNREVQPVGGSAPRKVDVLIVAATHRDLQARVESGHFRQDLLARLDATHVRLPPLRERPEDVFSVLDALARAEGCAWGAIEVEAVERLLLHDWPTNVRGIKRLLARLPVTEGAVALQRWAVDDVIGAPAPREAVETSTLTAQSVKEALAAADGNQSAAARRLGVSRGKLRRFLDKAT